MEEILKIVLIVVLSYLLGSMPTAYLIALHKGVNIFEVGSGNMGATNVLRAMGFWWGITVWAFDSLKGIAAIILSNLIVPDHTAAVTVISATVAVVGHNWSLFATLITGTLRGGKGAAIWFGTMLVMAPIQVVVGMSVLGGFVIALTRYVSLAVLAMFGLSTLWMLVLIGQRQLPTEYTVYALLVTVMMLYRFRENIQRLLAGTERRLGERI
ncbi:MAG: glycerol-3-phosphate acyltransferase [Chloroflexi bacterium]|nr:glycerol-3-phosphate acyltransferase [Chloroflexota bacterium]